MPRQLTGGAVGRPRSPNRKKWLALVRKGYGFAEACRELGLSSDAYKNWLEEKAEARIIVGIDRDERRAPQLDFLEFRERFFKRSNFWFHDDAYRHIENNSRLIMLLPPEHAKTTVWSIEFSAYLLMHNPDLRICVIQKSQVEAKKIVSAVQQRLTDHAFYERLGIPLVEDPIMLYGGPLGFRPERSEGTHWGSEAFTLRNVTSGEKDPSMQAKGWTSDILSNRIDLMIVDDIQDIHDLTPEQATKRMDWLQHNAITRLGKNGKLIVLGSRIGPGDFYEAVLDQLGHEPHKEYNPDEVRFRWPVVKYPAILPDGELLAPDLWDKESLDKKRFDVGETRWWTNWMQEDVDPQAATFTREKMRAALDRDRVLGERPSKATDVVVGIDPAISGFCAMVVWGVNRKTGTRYLIDLVNEQGMRTWDNVAAKAAELVARHGAQDVVVETNNTQGDVYLRVRDAVKPARCHPYMTATAMGARAEEIDFDISSIGTLYDRTPQEVSLPYGDGRTAEAMDAYIAQFCSWRPKPPGRSAWRLVRDMVMATLFAEWKARSFVGRSHAPSRDPDIPRWASNGEGRWSWMPKTGPKRKRLKTLSNDELIKMRE